MIRISFGSGLFLAAALGLAACSYHEEKNPRSNPIGTQGGGGGTNPGVDPASFKAVSANILGPSCTRCHGATSAKGGVRLHTYEDVMENVKAGSADDSLLYQKLIDAGDPMPPKGMLPDDVIKVVAEWINKGAKND